MQFTSLGSSQSPKKGPENGASQWFTTPAMLASLVCNQFPHIETNEQMVPISTAWSFHLKDDLNLVNIINKMGTKTMKPIKMRKTSWGHKGDKTHSHIRWTLATQKPEQNKTVMYIEQKTHTHTHITKWIKEKRSQKWPLLLCYRRYFSFMGKSFCFEVVLSGSSPLTQFCSSCFWTDFYLISCFQKSPLRQLVRVPSTLRYVLYQIEFPMKI